MIRVNLLAGEKVHRDLRDLTVSCFTPGTRHFTFSHSSASRTPSRTVTQAHGPRSLPFRGGGDVRVKHPGLPYPVPCFERLLARRLAEVQRRAVRGGQR